MTVEKVRAALAVIPADDYHVWIKVGGALWSEFGAEGEALFDEWSKKSAKYDAAQCAEKYRTLAKLKRVGIASVFYLADQADPGWRDTYRQQGAEGAKAESENGPNKDGRGKSSVIIRASDIESRKGLVVEGTLAARSAGIVNRDTRPW